jgi:hypothetical protein
LLSAAREHGFIEVIILMRASEHGAIAGALLLPLAAVLHEYWLHAVNPFVPGYVEACPAGAADCLAWATRFDQARAWTLLAAAAGGVVLLAVLARAWRAGRLGRALAPTLAWAGVLLPAAAGASLAQLRVFRQPCSGRACSPEFALESYRMLEAAQDRLLTALVVGLILLAAAWSLRRKHASR